MLKTAVCFASLVLVVLCFSSAALAWDDTGHKLTAYIAWQRMTPDVREKVIKILLSAPEDAQLSTFYLSYGARSPEAKKREFFMLVASWADIVRDKNFDTRFKKYHNGTWHYSDTFWTWKDGKAVLVESPEPGGLAMQKLLDFDKVIRSSAPDAEKAIAIAWLEHLIGDIHQPLHTSGKITDTDPKGDQGGNLFYLTPKGTPREQQRNLHSFWDGIIGQNIPNAKDVCEADYLYPIGDEIIKAFPYEKEKSRINPDKYDLWAKESFDIATSEVYKDVTRNEPPTEAYKKKALKIAEEQIALAGYRMADLFNEVFGAAAATSTAPAK